MELRRIQTSTRKYHRDIQSNRGHMDKWIGQYISEALAEDRRRKNLRDQLHLLVKKTDRISPDVLSRLLSQNPDINAPNHYGRTALHLAALTGSEQPLDWLLQRTDLKLNAQDKAGMTALHIAVEKKQVGCIKRLLAAGANTEVADNKGRFPKHYAPDGEIKDIFRRPQNLTSSRFRNKDGKTMKEKPALTSKPSMPVEDGMDNKLANWVEGSFWEPDGPVKWERLSVWELIYSEIEDAVERRRKKKKWIHLPVVSQIWAQDIVRSIFAAQQRPESEAQRACRFIHTVFEEREVLTRQELKDQEMISIVLPIIDIDRLAYIHQAKEVCEAIIHDEILELPLQNVFCSMWSPEEEEVHILRALQLCAYHDQPLPLTLDQSYHGSLNRSKLSELDSDQVLTKYLTLLKKKYSPDNQNFPRAIEAWDAPPIKNDIPDPPPAARTDIRETEKGTSLSPESINDRVAREKSNETNIKKGPDEIVVIPNFWMFKIDEDTVLTLYPGRWDKTSEADLHTHLLDQVAQDEEIHHSGVNMIHVAEHIIKACVNFEALTYFKWKKEGAYPDHTDIDVSYMTAFADSIGQLFVEATELYSRFSRGLGSLSIDSQAFYRSVEYGTGKLIEIDDILGEIGMIKRIQLYQVEAMRMFSHVIWGDLEDWRYGEPQHQAQLLDGGRFHVLSRIKRGQGYTISEALLPFPSTFSLLEADAARVRSMLITTLLDLRHREATIENALSGTAQATMIFIFTVITVLFAPLAFVCSLLALPVQDLPGTWAKRPLAGVFGYATLATMGLCAIMWAIYKIYTHETAKRRNQTPQPPPPRPRELFARTSRLTLGKPFRRARSLGSESFSMHTMSD